MYQEWANADPVTAQENKINKLVCEAQGNSNNFVEVLVFNKDTEKCEWMSTWNINLDKKTATSINGITFKLTEVEPDKFQWICANPKGIPPDDLDDEILGKMVKEADAMYWKGNVAFQGILSCCRMAAFDPKRTFKWIAKNGFLRSC